MARYFVRGEMNQPCLVIECADVQQVIANGSNKFPNFSARNPWIFSDSIRGMAWVFIDPESSIMRAICNDWNHVGESLPLAEAGEKYAVLALPLLRGHPATPRSRFVALRAFICLLLAGCSVPANAFSLVCIAWPAHPARTYF